MDVYDLLERFSIMTVDGNQTDAAALDFIRRTYPKTLSNGLYGELMETISKRPSGNAPENTSPERPTKQKEKADAPNFETLRQYTAAGFTLYAQKAGKNKEGNSFPYYVDWKNKIDRYTKGAGKQDAAISTEAELQTAIENGVKIFVFMPGERNYLCIDLDRGHENGIDGLQVFADYFTQRGIEYDFFESGAVYVDTPSGGRHLYFKDWTDTEKYLTVPFKNVEVRARGNDQTLTAAGSVKKETLYRLHGTIKDAPELPNWLVKHITPRPTTRTAAPVRKAYTPRNQGGYSLGKLVDFVLQDKAGEGRNNTAYTIGFRIGKQYDIESVIAECRGRELFAGFPESELRTAINSGMKNSKY